MKSFKRLYTFIALAGLFMVTSAVLYFIHYLIFRDTHHIFIYLLGDVAFLPLEVFLVVIVLERILANREKQAMMQKLNMVVGAFFSEVGNELLRGVLPALDIRQELNRRLGISRKWTRADFRKADEFTKALQISPDSRKIKLDELKRSLLEKREFLLRLLENPNVLEDERFTDLLWATFHLTEELESRITFDNVPDTDRKHLEGDMERMYHYLVTEWLVYVEHLKIKYPYLFSLVLRTHPFQDNPSPVITAPPPG